MTHAPVTMTVRINSEAHETAAETVADLVSSLGQPPEMLLIEHNGIALTRSEWRSSRLADGDRLEVLRVAAGG